MPTYDYVCEKCGHRFEFVQSMNDAKLTDCPLEGCDGNVKRLLGTGAGIIFKGGGFYQTDYRSDSYKSGEKKEADSAKPAESASKSESGKGAESGGKGAESSGKGAESSGKGAESKKPDSGGSAGSGGSAAKKAD